MYIVQARRPHGRYFTLDSQSTIGDAIWSMRQYDVGFHPWVDSTFRIVDESGKVIARSTPKRGAK